MRSQPVVRPNVWQWLRYCFTGSIAPRHHSWVLYDATCSTWALRHAARYAVLISPLIAAVMVFLPTSTTIRIEACFAAGVSLWIGYMCFTTEALEHRVVKAGYPYGIAGQQRELRANQAQRAAVARNRARREDRRVR